MDEKDETIDYYYSLKPTDFPILERLDIHQDVPYQGRPVELSLEIRMRPPSDTDRRRLLLSFQGVRDLRLIQPSWSEFHMSLIEINSIRSQQWENLNYQVKETEEASLSFLCKHFDTTIEDV